MKRILWIAAALALLTAGLCLCAAAAEPGGSCGNSVTWQLEATTGILRISGSGPMWDFDDENPGWHDQADAITSVVIEEGVTSVGDFAFYFLPMGSSSIAHVTLPQSLTDIGQYAFAGCSSLTELDIPYSVTVIRSGALYRCDGLADENGFITFRNTLYGYTGSAEHVTIPAGITEISGSAFKDCLFLTSVTFPSGLNNIREYAFDNCALLASVAFPDSLATIQNYAFCFCSGLEKVEFSENLIFLGENAFYRCTSLREAFFYNPETYFSRAPFTQCEDLTLFGFSSSTAQAHAQSHDIPFLPLDGACGDDLTWTLVRGALTVSGMGPMWDFDDENPGWHDQAGAITSVVIEEGVTSVGDFAFYFLPMGSSSVAHVTLPQSLTDIGQYAFAGCSSLTELDIPYTVTVIRSGALYRCDSLADENGFIIFRSTLYGYTGSAEHVTIPAGITEISGSAFKDCLFLTGVTFPSGLNNIREYAFDNCALLASVAFPASLATIQNYAFCFCSGLEKVEFPESLIFLGENAFYRCSSLREAFFYNPETYFSRAPFTQCEDLTLFGFSSSTAQAHAQSHEIQFKPLDGACGDDVTWTLIRGTLTISGTGPMWSDYNNEPSWTACGHGRRISSVVIEDGVTSICPYAFHFAPAPNLITRIIIPQSVTTIEDYAFAECSSLTSLNIPDTVTVMGSGVLFRCYGLANENGFIIFRDVLYGYAGTASQITVPAGITAISGSAFLDNGSLTAISLPDSLNTIQDRAFYNCSALSSVTLPAHLTSIQLMAFDGCTSLTSVTIPESVIFIGGWAYSGCANLTEAVILNPDAVIASDAFINCPGLSLCGMLPSTAKDYADGHSIPFTAIGGPCGDGVTWAWNRDTGVVTFSGTGPMWDYTWDDHSPLYYHSGMTTAVIGEGVTSVGAFLFHGCKKLAFVSIPDSVNRIGSSAFIYCSALDNVTIPEGVTSIRSLFLSCTSLTHVTLPQSLTAIEQSSFYGCTGLTGLDFVPDTVTAIRDLAFYGCTGLTDVTVPRGISAIGYCVFQNCTNLTSVTVHRGIQRIDRYAFDGDTSLANVFYEGVRSEWDAIVISSEHNDPLLSAALHCRFAVVFDTVGGYPDIPMQAVDPEGLPTEPAAPRKIGAVFAGWYTDAEYSNRYNFLIPVTDDLTLYASWAYPAPAGVLKLPAGLTAIEDRAFAGVGAEGVILRDTVSVIAGSAFEGSQIRYIFGFDGSEADAFAQSHPSFVFVPIDQNWLSTH